jgi:phosphate acetyltransferase
MVFQSLPNEFRKKIVEKAFGKRVALPEGEDMRIQEAATILEREFSVKVRLGTAEFAERNRSTTLELMLKKAELRGKKLTEQQSSLASDSFYEAGAALERGEVDAVVGGAVQSTAHVIRAALATVGLKAQVRTITSGFLFALKQPTLGGQQALLYADCAVLPSPTSEQLVDIALLASESFSKWTGLDPHVSFLSFSTAGSAEHEDVLKMRNAAIKFRELYPNILSEGEIQFDAAVVPDIAVRKNSETKLQGKANVFIFPDLNAGNICYKMTQRLAGAEAWGPILFGTAKPFSDLSRGASALDIVHNVMLTLAL